MHVKHALNQLLSVIADDAGSNMSDPLSHHDHDDHYVEDFGQDLYEDNRQDLATLVTHCVLPSSLNAAFEFLLPLIFANITLRLLLAGVRNQTIAHLVTISIGILSVTYQLREDLSLPAVLVIHSVTSAFLLLSFHGTDHRKKAIWIFCLSALLFNECIIWWSIRPHHVRIRTHLMLLTMKFISWSSQLDDDHDHDHQQISGSASFFPCLSYALHPMSLVLGSWHPVVPVTSPARGRYVKSVSNLTVAIISLLVSNCFVQFLVTEFIEPLIFFNLYNFLPEKVAEAFHKTFISYFVALQFRSSHYFICFATEASFSFWGSDMKVARPGSIEYPRSLVDVVVSWNIPFHIWIRKHVFKPLKLECGASMAVLLTYCISSLLHGLNFQIFSVLFSLGCLTLLEFRLRHKLSVIYNACIQSKSCPADCGHETDGNRCVPIIANTVFTIIAVIHLSFLGSAFDGREDSSDMKHVLEVWSSLGFYSPCLAALTWISYTIMSFVIA